MEERITYLGGQKDLAATQKKQHETMRVEISEGITALQNEIAALEEKQFAGLDTDEMQERLVELSQRYDEMARDERGDTVQRQKELHALREKIGLPYLSSPRDGRNAARGTGCAQKNNF